MLFVAIHNLVAVHNNSQFARKVEERLSLTAPTYVNGRLAYVETYLSDLSFKWLYSRLTILVAAMNCRGVLM